MDLKSLVSVYNSLVFNFPQFCNVGNCIAPKLMSDELGVELGENVDSIFGFNNAEKSGKSNKLFRFNNRSMEGLNKLSAQEDFKVVDADDGRMYSRKSFAVDLLISVYRDLVNGFSMNEMKSVKCVCGDDSSFFLIVFKVVDGVIEVIGTEEEM